MRGPSSKSFLGIMLLVIAAQSMLLSCARVGAPPGGAEDKTGPQLIASEPANDAVNVPRSLVARLVFSEPVNRPSVEAALFLSPDPRQRLMYRWRGETLELIYLDSLVEDRTYVISVGSQAKDLRGNPIGESATVAFSTGPVIDRGTIDGWIADAASPQAVNLWAYRLRGDTIPDPGVIEPDYRLQGKEDGTFRMGYMRGGRYRMFAVTDRNFDGLWNPQSEQLGLPPWDLTVSDVSVPWISFRLTAQDTAPAEVRNAREIHAGLVDVRLSRPVTALASVLVGAAGDTVPQLTAFTDSVGADLWHVYPAAPLSAGEWRIHAEGTDFFGQNWSDEDTLHVRARADTARPKLVRSEPAVRTRVRLVPEVMSLQFDEPVKLDSATELSFQLVVSDTDSVAVTPALRDARFVDLTPALPFTENLSYRLLFDGRAIRDLSGNANYDSTVTIPFSVYSADSLGQLHGELAGGTNAQYLFRVLTLENRREVAVTKAPGPGIFEVDRLPPGRYLLEVIRDDDGNGVYSYGRYFPFTFSEPFLVSSDTISIRARWEYDTRVNWPPNPEAP